MKRHIDYAVELARVAYSGINKVMLFGSVAKGRERPDSDVDVIFIEGEDKDWDLASRIFCIVREIPVRFELEFLDERSAKDREYMSMVMRELENPYYYVNAMEEGLLFDGKGFSRRAKEDDNIKNCLMMMKDIIKDMDVKRYKSRYDP